MMSNAFFDEGQENFTFADLVILPSASALSNCDSDDEDESTCLNHLSEQRLNLRAEVVIYGCSSPGVEKCDVNNNDIAADGNSPTSSTDPNTFKMDLRNYCNSFNDIAAVQIQQHSFLSVEFRFRFGSGLPASNYGDLVLVWIQEK